MTKADLSRQEISSITKRLLDKINKQHEPTPKERFDQAIFNRTWNPETMPAGRLREFQSHGWFMDSQPRDLTPEQTALEEQQFQAIVNEAFPFDNES